MGFFDFLDRMAKGEPIFQETDEANEHGQKQPSQPATPPEAKGPTIQKYVESSFPVVQIKSVKEHRNGNRTQVYCSIASSWPEEVELDKIRIFDTKRELDTILRPREERDFLVYDGPALTREYHEVQLDYKTQKEGDYFQTVHQATFTYQPQDKTYLVSSIHISEAVRDIYG